MNMVDTLVGSFAKIFASASLANVYVGRPKKPIFDDLNKNQRKDLKGIISNLRCKGDTYFSNVIKIVVQLFDRLNETDINFLNFISLTKFVVLYVESLVHNANGNIHNIQFYECVTPEIVDDMTDIWSLYQRLSYQTLCRNTSVYPSFHSIPTAVYHYYKHRMVPHRDIILSVDEYYDLIESLLHKLKTLSQFKELSPSSREIEFERCLIRQYGSTLRIVVKLQGDAVVLSSCYFLSQSDNGDCEGDDYIKVKGKKREKVTRL